MGQVLGHCCLCPPSFCPNPPLLLLPAPPSGSSDLIILGKLYVAGICSGFLGSELTFNPYKGLGIVFASGWREEKGTDPTMVKRRMIRDTLAKGDYRREKWPKTYHPCFLPISSVLFFHIVCSSLFFSPVYHFFLLPTHNFLFLFLIMPL